MPRASFGAMTAACIMGASSLIAITAANAQDQTAAGQRAPAAAVPASDRTAAGSASATTGLAEIVVTAEKRATNLQKTPISITAVSGDQLQKAQIRDLQQVKTLVPAMQMGEADGYAQITIRGIGTSGFVAGAESAVAVNLNEVYISRPIAQLTGLYDLSSLEALRGPQGTLFGRNATAGAINMTTTRPTDQWSGYGRVTVGNYAAVNAEGAVGGPIAGDTLMFRIAGFIDKHDGYGKNLTTGNPVGDKDSRGIRGTLLFKPTSTLSATVIAEYFKESDHSGAVHFEGSTGLSGLPGTSGQPILAIQQGGFVTGNRQDIVSALDPEFRLRTTAVTGILEWKNGPFSLKSISGYRDQDSRTFTPLDDGNNANAIYYAGEPARQFSEELQAHYDTSRLHATAGLYYFHERDASQPGVSAFKYSILAPAFGLPPIPAAQDYFVDFVEIGGTLRTTAKAAFGQISYEILDGLTITGGIRYSDERKGAALQAGFNLTAPWTFNTPQPPVNFVASKTFHSTTPKIGVQYQLTSRTLVYASYSKGFKSGGYDVTTAAPAFEPEKLTDYEGGIKTTLWDNRLRLNLSGFFYNYSNLQVLEVIGTNEITTNAATAHIYGSEAEITILPVRELQIDFAGSWLHARYQKYFGPSAVQSGLAEVDYSGHSLNSAPDFSGHAAATYSWDMPHGTLALRGELEFATRMYFTPDNIDMISAAGNVKENAFLTYTSEHRWSATAFVRNLSNKDTFVSGVVVTPLLGSGAHGAVAPPRTFGVELGYKF